jgi:hypothetical protein
VDQLARRCLVVHDTGALSGAIVVLVMRLAGLWLQSPVVVGV